MKPEVLTHEIAKAILNEAYKDVRDKPFYRLGQAIFNRLPNGIGAKACGTQYDMFFTTDNQEAEDLLWQLVNWVNEAKDNGTVQE